MVLVAPADAALILGCSRQAILKQRSRLDRSGQALMEDGKWKVLAPGLCRWWVNHTRTGDHWAELVNVLKLMGEKPEAELLRHGGLRSMQERLELLALLRPGWGLGVDDYGRLWVGPEGADGPPEGKPMEEAWLALGADLKTLPKGCLIDPETGQAIDKATGAVLKEWCWPTLDPQGAAADA